MKQVNIESPFPLVISTVDALIVDSFYDPKQILLGRKENDPNLKWRFIGGFTEIDSFSDEEDAIRETYEETGIKALRAYQVGSCPIDDSRYKDGPHQVRTRIFAIKYNPLDPIKANDDIDALSWFSVDQVNLRDILIDAHHVIYDVISEKWPLFKERQSKFFKS